MILKGFSSSNFATKLGCVQISNNDATLSVMTYNKFYTSQTVVCRYTLTVTKVDLIDLEIELTTPLGDLIDIQNPYIYSVGDNLPCTRLKSKDVSYKR